MKRFLVCACALALIAVAAPTQAQSYEEVPVVTDQPGVNQVAATSDYLAWAQGSEAKPGDLRIIVKKRGGDRFRISPRGAEATVGGIDGSKLVYQQFRGTSEGGGTSNIKIMNLRTRKARSLSMVNTKHWEFQPSISGRWLLFARANHDAGRVSTLLTNLRTGNTRKLDETRTSSSIMQVGRVNGKYAVWLRWVRGGLPRLVRYNIETGKKATVPNGGRYNWAPSVTRDGTVYFGRTGSRCGSNGKLLRWSGGSDVDTLVNFPDGIDISDTDVVGTNTPELFYNRIPCDRIKRGTDIYKLRRAGGSEPSPSPSPSSTPSSSPSSSPTNQQQATLTVTVGGNGAGSVTSSPTGIDCGSDCSESYAVGTQVTLTATAADKSSFEGWGGACSGTSTTCTITIQQDTSVTASFKPGN